MTVEVVRTYYVSPEPLGARIDYGCRVLVGVLTGRIVFPDREQYLARLRRPNSPRAAA